MKRTGLAAVVLGAIAMVGCSSSSPKSATTSTQPATTSTAGASATTAGASATTAGASATTAGASATTAGAPASTCAKANIGLLYDATGALAVEFKYALTGAKARFAYAAAHGGPTITIDEGDSAADPTRNLQQAQRMVAANDFAIMEDDVADSGSAALLHTKGVPVVGFALAPAWGQNDNMFGFSGATNPSDVYTQLAQTMLDAGATRLASVGIGSNAAAMSSAQNNVTAFTKLGGAAGFVDSVQFGQQQFTANVQKLKDEKVDALILGTDAASGIGYYLAAQQAGISLKVVIELQGYEPDTITTFGSKLAGVYFSTSFAPLETASTNPAVQAYIDAMKQYAPDVDPHSSHALYGWVSADLILRGIQDAGGCDSPGKFISSLKADTSWNAGGLGPTVDYTKNQTSSTGCAYLLKVNDGGTAFVPQNNGDPVCGTKIAG